VVGNEAIVKFNVSILDHPEGHLSFNLLGFEAGSAFLYHKGLNFVFVVNVFSPDYDVIGKGSVSDPPFFSV